MTKNPIICIGNYYIDKKIKLMKVCHTFELKTPTKNEMSKIIDTEHPNLEDDFKETFINYCQGDIRKLHTIFHLLKNNDELKKNFKNI